MNGPVLVTDSLTVKGPDDEGDYELCWSAESDSEYEYHYLGRAACDRLIAALSPSSATPCDVPTILAMMRAADAHMDALRAAVERIAAENAELRQRCGESR